MQQVQFETSMKTLNTSSLNLMIPQVEQLKVSSMGKDNQKRKGS